MAAKRLGKNRELTSREKSILEFIRQKIYEDGFPPTVREICTAVNLRSTPLYTAICPDWKSWESLKEILPAPGPLRWLEICPGATRR